MCFHRGGKRAKDFYQSHRSRRSPVAYGFNSRTVRVRHSKGIE